MMMIAWVLWALQLAGVIALEYGKLWFITVTLLVVCAIAGMIKNKAAEKLVQLEMDAAGNVKDEAAVPVLLAMILRKIATK